LVPGNYTVRWEGTVEGDLTVQTEIFLLADTPVTTADVIDPPSLQGVMRESHQYDIMGIGLTDNLFLIGHADGIGINSPFQVNDVKEAVTAIGGDVTCPLLRAMLEAYNAGSRDMWLVASAPMSEYIPFDGIDKSDRLLARDEWGGLTWYERYQQRLQTTYAALVDWENIEFLVPVEAAFYDSGDVNFFDDLVFNCYDRFKKTGYPSIGFLGTQMGAWSDSDLTAVLDTAPVNGVGLFSKVEFLDYVESIKGASVKAEVEENIPYKFGILIFGEAAFTIPQIPVVYNNSVATTAAAVLSVSRLDRGLTYKALPNVLNPLGRDLKTAQIQTLARARINPLVRRAKGKRGSPYKCVIASDNLFMPDGTDFWSIVSMRLVAKVVQEIKHFGESVIGSINYNQFRSEVQELLKLLSVSGNIKDFDLNIYRRPPTEDPDQTVLVTIVLYPFFGVREIFFQVEVGPGV